MNFVFKKTVNRVKILSVIIKWVSNPYPEGVKLGPTKSGSAPKPIANLQRLELNIGEGK